MPRYAISELTRSARQPRTAPAVRLALMVLVGLASLPSQAGSAELGQGLWPAFTAGAPPPPSTSYAATTGLLHIPSAQVLEQGVMALHYDTFWDRRFSGRTQHGYDAGMVVGLLPGIELSGRMANYGRDGPPDPRTGFDPLVIRDLSANFKIQLPRLLRGQPDIALGATDVGGAASNFRSKYLVATQRFGPAQFTLGYGRGPDQFDGLFGGVQLGLFNTGLGLLAEHDGRDEFIGLRYASPPIDWLNGARLVGTLSRSLGAHNELGERQDRTEFSVVLRLPLGTPARPRAAAGAASAGIAAVPQVAAPANPVVQAAPVPSVSPQAKSSSKPPAPRADTAAATADATADAPPADLALIVDLAKRLEAGGLDHVRVGITGESRSVLVARFDPSLYARNDMDAVGVALGVMAQGSVGRYVTHLVAVIERAGQPLYQLTVDRDAWLAWLRGERAAAATVRSTLTVRPKSAVDAWQVQWHGPPRRIDRLRLALGLRYKAYYATEVATFDYSVGLAGSAYVPLWKGAELSGTLVDQQFKTENFRAGGVFSGNEVRSGLASAALNQSWWLGKRLLNVTSVGQFFYDYRGVQHESRFFLPWNDDALRFRITRTSRFDASRYGASRIDSSQFGYLLQGPWPHSVLELNYNDYQTGDSGVSVDFRRYFGDIAVGLTLRNSERARFAGLTLGIPLAPRQGWRTGLGASVNGEPQFNTGLLSRVGSSNNSVALDGAVPTVYEYDGSNLMFNRNRFQRDYVVRQLPRMRESYLMHLKRIELESGSTTAERERP